ncbi:hypothetical protein TSMEX_003246 [Taenia solium]|eukprot:TsM_000277500 transcript=TsM_000277500 gene=TsM_000277500
MFDLTDDECSALALSFFFCLLVYAGGQLLKKCLLFVHEKSNGNAIQTERSRAAYLHESIHVAFQDGVAAFQACACSLENAIARVTLGNMALLASITIHGLLMLKFAWRDAYGSTCNVFYRYLMNQTDLPGVCLSWCLQLLGAFFALHISYFWWGLRLSTHHACLHGQRLLLQQSYEDYDDDEFNDSVGDLHVSLPVGIGVEAGVAFMDVLLSGALPALLNLWKRRHLERRQEDWQMLEFVVFSVRQAVAIYLLHLGLPLTGAYANGVNAVIQTWGLGRASNPLHHLIVYWFSPLLGVWGGIVALKGLQNSTFMWTRHPASSVGLFDLHEASLAATISTSISSSPLDETTPSMHLTSPYNVAGEGLQLAAVCASPKTFRSKSLTRQRPERIAWRRSSRCRLLPQSSRDSQPDIASSASFAGSLDTAGLGDSRESCRRCPIRNQLEGEEEEEGVMEFISGLRRRRNRSFHACSQQFSSLYTEQPPCLFKFLSPLLSFRTFCNAPDTALAFPISDWSMFSVPERIFESLIVVMTARRSKSWQCVAEERVRNVNYFHISVLESVATYKLENYEDSALVQVFSSQLVCKAVGWRQVLWLDKEQLEVKWACQCTHGDVNAINKASTPLAAAGDSSLALSPQS